MTSQSEPAPKRGRPQLVTRQKIADAGIELTIPEITITALADKMGVSVRSLYKHTSGIEEIQQIVAEEIFARWRMPPPEDETFADHLFTFSNSLRFLALDNPGISEFLTQFRRHHSRSASQAIKGHHAVVAERYGIDFARASFVLTVTAEHTLAVVELVHRPATTDGKTPDRKNSASNENHVLTQNEELRFEWSMRALIRGLQDTIDDLPVQLLGAPSDGS